MFGNRTKSKSIMKLGDDQSRYAISDGRPVSETKKRKSKVKNPKSTVSVADEPNQCPCNPKHTRLRVYEVTGTTAYNVCDDCGAIWQTDATLVEDLCAYCLRFAASLDNAKRTESYNDRVIVLEDRMARDIAKTLRSLVARFIPPETGETNERKKSRKT